MFCNKCGKEIPDSAKFCNFCGASAVVEDLTANGMQSKPKKKPSIVIWIALALVVVLAVAGFAGYKLYTSPAARMNREIKSGDYSAALEIYQDDLEDGELSSKTLKLLNTGLAELQAAYDAQTLTYEEVLEDLDVLSAFGDRELRASVATAREIIVNQRKVMDLTEIAEECLQSEDFVSAILNYKSALAIDPASEAAAAGLEQAYDQYRSALLANAADYEEKGDYESALRVLQSGLNNLENDTKLLNEIEAVQERHETYIEEQTVLNTIAESTKLLNDRQYDEALVCINTALENYPGNETLLRAYDETYAAIPGLIIEEAKGYRDSGDYWDALWLLAHCKEQYPDSQEAEAACQKMLIDYLQDLEDNYGCVLHYNGHIYCQFHHDNGLNYEQVESEWELLDAHLATLTSEGENTAVYEHLKSCGWENTFFGLSDANEEGIWLWCTGEPFDYSNWGTDNEPNGGTRENYGMYYQAYPDGTWNDYPFDAAIGYVVEWDMDLLVKN